MSVADTGNLIAIASSTRETVRLLNQLNTQMAAMNQYLFRLTQLAEYETAQVFEDRKALRSRLTDE